MNYIKTTNTPFLGVSFTLLKNVNCSHAWFIISDYPCRIDNPNMILHGAGPVDGPSQYLS